MSLLRISHETVYRYARTVRFGPHRLVLRPREGHDLQVERMTLTIQPAHRLEWHRDLFGNSVAVVLFHEQSRELSIMSEVEVRRFELPSATELSSEPISFPVVYDQMEQIAAQPYLQPVFPQESDAVRDWAQRALNQTDRTDALSVADALNRTVRSSITYLRREEKGVQTPLRTLELGTGSCRDMATLLMESCRSLGIVSRFCSGYLDCVASQVGRASTHAWAELYLPGQGWLGFDPTLAERTSTKHITIGLSNHPRGVMPVSGTFFGANSDYLELKVAVKFSR